VGKSAPNKEPRPCLPAGRHRAGLSGANLINQITIWEQSGREAEKTDDRQENRSTNSAKEPNKKGVMNKGGHNGPPTFIRSSIHS
jgi:hypothetical protein